MTRALDRSLRRAARLAVSEEHFKRLAFEAVVEVLYRFDAPGFTRRLVASFFAWVPLAWRSSTPATTPLEQAAAAQRQMQAVTAHLFKQVDAYAAVRLEKNAGRLFDQQKERSLNRAAFYARDQAGLLYHEAARVQASYDGYIGYVWVRTTSASPRDVHLARVGRFFEYGEVADEPGMLPNCKCSMHPMKTRP